MISIKYHSGIYTLETKLTLPISVDEAWEFFSSPENLCRMTPKHMNFRITSGKPESMYRGQIISYQLSPIPGIRTNWVTEITQVDEQKYFVDEQRFGPYSMWHHEHRFIETSEGVLMTDKVSYKLPFGFLGRFSHAVFVKKQLMHIFSFRSQVLSSLF
ncbi:SRPBCC family protein [Mangrovibacterium sp.]|uniref:SRPBCC family protein n=1 Tax=Mangrovibacterium sp. TaxID=1961364 RepID=UPI003568245B